MSVILWIILPLIGVGGIVAGVIIYVIKTEEKRNLRAQAKQMKKEQDLQEYRKKVMGEQPTETIVQPTKIRHITCRYCGYATPEDMAKCQHCGAAI